MNLSDLLDKRLVLPELQSTTKHDVLAELVSPVSEKIQGFDLEQAHKVLLERERLGTTGIGDGVAIPHGKMASLDDIVLVVGRSIAGLDYEALDFKLCTIFFLVLAPEQVAGMHLRVLAHISRLLKEGAFRESFMEAPDGDAIWNLLVSA